MTHTFVRCLTVFFLVIIYFLVLITIKLYYPGAGLPLCDYMFAIPLMIAALAGLALLIGGGDD